MSEEYKDDSFRYLFTVRQTFGEEPCIDCFYQVQIPEGLSGSEADMMRTLKPDWCQKEIQNDNSAMFGMNMRLRFNSDMYQSVCMVTTQTEISAGDLEEIIKVKHRDGELKDFLDKSAIGR